MQEIYTCPMHPEVQKEFPGICPKCGMELVLLERGKGHVHRDHLLEIKRKAVMSTLLTIPILFYSKGFQELLGFKVPGFYGSALITPLLSIVLYFYGGLFFLKGSLGELRIKKPGMMSLVSLAISSAFLYSLYATLTGGMDFFWELSTLIVVMLWGHFIEMSSVLGASKAIEELARLMPAKANLIKGAEVVEVSISSLRPGDLVLVKPGEMVPADGYILEGLTYMDEALLTGESKPVPKKEGDKVIGGAINIEGAIKVRIEKTGKESYLYQVMRLVREAQESKTRLQDIADRMAFYLTLTAILVGSFTFILWLLLNGDLQFAVERAVTVMVIACPHALGLAIPLVVAITTSYSSTRGVLIRNRLSLELLRSIDIVVFDKTGTLTEGAFGVSDVYSKGMDERELLRLCASVEMNSEHVIAKAIVKSTEVVLGRVRDFKAYPGKGASGKINHIFVVVGTELLMDELGIEKDSEVIEKGSMLQKQGKSVVFVAIDGKLKGLVALSDRVRKESYEAVREIKAMGKSVAMLTGDAEDVAKWVAEELGIDEYFAKVLPHEKAEKIKELQKKGFKVAMVGDGINDAPALMQADVGIAIGSGTNVAIESAGIILVKDDPRDVVRAIKLSKVSYTKMIQNLLWAIGYNFIAIPLAAGVAYKWGILLPPAIAALLMSASTAVVSFNALLMRRLLNE